MEKYCNISEDTLTAVDEMFEMFEQKGIIGRHKIAWSGNRNPEHGKLSKFDIELVKYNF